MNYDCVVNLTDLEILSSQWLQSNTDCFEADLDGDLSVNIKDFSQFASDWDNVQ